MFRMIEFHNALGAETQTDDGCGEESRIVDVRVDSLAGLVFVDD